MQAQNCVFLDFFVLPSGGEAATPLHPAAQRTTRAILVQPVSAVSAESSGFYTRQRRPAFTEIPDASQAGADPEDMELRKRMAGGTFAPAHSGWSRGEPEQHRSVRGSPHTAASCLRNAASCTNDSADPRSTGQRSGQFFSRMGRGLIISTPSPPAGVRHPFTLRSAVWKRILRTELSRSPRF